MELLVHLPTPASTLAPGAEREPAADERQGPAMGQTPTSTTREEGPRSPTREELADLFRPVESPVPRWVWTEALRFRAHRDEVGASIAYAATLRMLVRLQEAVGVVP